MMTPRILKSTYLALIAVLGSALLSACGGESTDDNSNPPPTGGNATPTPMITAAPNPTLAPTPDPAATMTPLPTAAPTNPPVINPNDDFNVESHSPLGGSTDRALVSMVEVTFNKPLVPATVSAQNVALKNGNNEVAIELDYQEGSASMEIQPSARLAPNTTYTVELSANLMSQDGESLSETSWQFTTSGNLGDTPQDVIDTCMSEVDMEMLDAVNNVRARGYNCASKPFGPTYPMRWNCDIAAAAARHSNDMASNNIWGHTGSDGSSGGDRITQTGYSWRGWAENIAAGQPNVSAAMEDWLTSTTGHCKNIMSGSLVDFGSSLVVPTQGGTQFSRYWTQNFAAPR